jgi:hypothetical protein
MYRRDSRTCGSRLVWLTWHLARSYRSRPSKSCRGALRSSASCLLAGLSSWNATTAATCEFHGAKIADATDISASRKCRIPAIYPIITICTNCHPAEPCAGAVGILGEFQIPVVSHTS